MAVNEAVKIPVFRPLIGSDKQEIIARAEEIGTFDISTEAAPDCCTLFMPRRTLNSMPCMRPGSCSITRR